MSKAIHTTQGIFKCLIFKEEPTVGEVIAEAGWGSNREIRQKGFRIDPSFSEESPFFSRRVKEMPKIKDPKVTIKDGQAILVPNGTHVIVVRVNLIRQKDES